MIDEPIIEIVNAFNTLPYCFTLQSCYGHFVYSGQKSSHNLEPLPVTDTIKPQQSVQYALGTIYSLKNGIDLSLEGYYKEMYNMIEYKEGA